MFSIGLKLKLKAGKLEAYRAAHDALWPEVAESMTRNRVNMAIFEAGEDTLFVFASAPSTAHWLASREDPHLLRWNRAMTEFLAEDDAGSIRIDELQKVFGFGEYQS